jgi:CheY-like chemotaxis protein
MKNIMTVDDSSSLRQMIGLVLRTAGYRVIEASDGVDALSKLKGEDVNLFLVDVNMPNMGGLEFTRQVRASTRLADHGIECRKEAGRQGSWCDGMDRQALRSRSTTGSGEEGDALMPEVKVRTALVPDSQGSRGVGETA